MTDHALTLMQWLSPAYPVGAFAYSHGLECAVAEGHVRDGNELSRWLTDLLTHGGARSDAVLLSCAYRAETAADLSEAEARKRHGDRFKIIRVSYAQNDRAQAERRTEGVLKLLTDRKGNILGAGIVGLQAGELISFFAYAMANKMKIGSFTKFVAPYPTLAEITKRAAIEFYRDQLGNPWLERIRKFNSLLP